MLGTLPYRPILLTVRWQTVASQLITQKLVDDVERSIDRYEGLGYDRRESARSVMRAYALCIAEDVVNGIDQFSETVDKYRYARDIANA